MSKQIVARGARDGIGMPEVGRGSKTGRAAPSSALGVAIAVVITALTLSMIALAARSDDALTVVALSFARGDRGRAGPHRA
jgi:hypothetical protein